MNPLLHLFRASSACEITVVSLVFPYNFEVGGKAGSPSGAGQTGPKQM